MTAANLGEKAGLLRSLHDGPVLVLPNAWDPVSAALLQRAGARAIATTSGGVAWALGRPDGQRVTRLGMVEAVGRIVTAVDVPVTADIEAGYGPADEDVAATVGAVAGVGAAGVNLEDSESVGGPLFDPGRQAERIRAARVAASAAGVADLVVNARTDVFLFEIGDAAGRLDDVVRRAERYAEAGADCLFVPGLLDLDMLRSLTAAVRLPVNAMAVPGGPSVSELGEAGVRRVSVGTALAQVSYTAALRSAEELLGTGTFTSFDGALDFAEVDSLFH